MQAEDTRTSAPSSSEQFGISEMGMLRIFEGVRVAKLTREGRVDCYRARGFHLEDTAVLEAKGYTVDERTRSSPDSLGVYQVHVFMFGKRRDPSAGFFPRGWTRQQVIEAIEQAFANKQPHVWGEFKHCFVGRTEAEMRVVMELDESGLVLDAFPLRAKVSKQTQILWRIERGLQRRSKHICSQCGRFKELRCPTGHPVKRKRLRKIRRVFRKAYWTLWRMF